jgi:transposase
VVRHQANAAEQAARRTTGERPLRPQRHLLGVAIRRTLARSAAELRPLHHLLQPFRSLAAGWRIMHALATTHGASVQMIDTSIVRVHQHAACITQNRRQSMGRSRGGLTSKIHAVVDTDGLPVQLALTAGEAHDNRLASKLLSRLKSGTMLLADRGYDADWIRALAAKRYAWANIPPRSNRNEPICFSPYLYRARNLVERFLNKIKQCRRVATRYDKLAANYLAFIQLASIRLNLHLKWKFPPRSCANGNHICSCARRWNAIPTAAATARAAAPSR